MSGQSSKSGAPGATTPGIEAFIGHDFNGIAARTTSECPNPAPNPGHTDTDMQEASIHVEISQISSQLFPGITEETRNALTAMCNAFARARSDADDLKRRGAQLQAEIDEHTNRLGVYCECFAVANKKVGEQDAAMRRLTDDIVGLKDASGEEGKHLERGVKEAQEKLDWLAAECGRLFSKVYGETNTVLGKRAEIRMGEGERRRLRVKALGLRAKAVAIARGDWVPTPEEMPGIDYVHL